MGKFKLGERVLKRIGGKAEDALKSRARPTRTKLRIYAQMILRKKTDVR